MNYSIRPEKHELRKARKAIESALERCKYVLEKEEGLEINLGASPDERHGAHGLARSKDKAQIYFNPSIDGWEKDLEKTTLNTYGVSYFYEKVEDITFVWQELLASVTGLLLLEEMDEDREPEKKNISEEWSEKKDILEQELPLEDSRDFSWELKLELGRKILESHELEQLPELNLSDVQKAGNEAF